MINMPQDITAFAESLPRYPSELDVIFVRKEGSQNSHRDFRVRKSVVQCALLWLKANNKYYRSIDIDSPVILENKSSIKFCEDIFSTILDISSCCSSSSTTSVNSYFLRNFLSFFRSSCVSLIFILASR